jgi:hypothetical protein
MFDHQVHVVLQTRFAVKAFHDGGAEADVGHEVSVHDIYVDVVGSSFFDFFDVIQQSAEIR